MHVASFKPDWSRSRRDIIEVAQRQIYGFLLQSWISSSPDYRVLRRFVTRFCKVWVRRYIALGSLVYEISILRLSKSTLWFYVVSDQFFSIQDPV